MFRPGFLAAYAPASLLLVLSLTATLPAYAGVRLEGSIRPFSQRVQVLGNAQDKARIEFQVSLPMRDRAGLQARINRNELIPPEEMSLLYYPSAQDHATLVQWLKSQGLTVEQTYANHLTIEVSGTVAQVRKALAVEFANVRVNGRDFVAARTAPLLPDNLAKLVLGINGLQPYQQAFPLSRVKPMTSSAPPYLVPELLKAYSANGLPVTGSGQKTAILIDRYPLDSDLTSFWSANGIAQSLSNIEKVTVVTGASTTSPQGEESLDVEWSSGTAPGSKVRIYATKDLSFVHIDSGFQKIISDLPTQPTLHQLSISLGSCEQDNTSSQLTTDSNLLASIAAGGVSTFVSSGDSGSNNNCTSGTGVSYFSSDPSVTAVGGTNLKISTSTGAVTSETAWACTGTCTTGGSGGGISSFFSRPSWQTNTGVTGTTRLVPDVSLDADPNTGYYVTLKGVVQQYGGTSASAPTWAGFAALINQGRASAGQSVLGLLNPLVYPLAGTSNFRDITSGSNGAYSAKAGYDLVTGIGVPVVSTLYSTLVSGGTVTTPSISSFSPSSGAVGTSVVISGSNFTGASAVKFNGTSASFTVNSASQITATVPVGATSGAISVTTSSGTATSASSFTVTTSGGGQLLGNTGFENGSTAPAPWTVSTGVISSSATYPSHSGTWKAWLDGYGAVHTDTLYQTVTIPTTASGALSFYLYITTSETTTTTAYDTLKVQVRNTAGTVLGTLATYSNLNKSTGYVQKSLSLAAYKGQTVQLYLVGTEDSSLKTSFLVDDFALN